MPDLPVSRFDTPPEATAQTAEAISLSSIILNERTNLLTVETHSCQLAAGSE